MLRLSSAFQGGGPNEFQLVYRKGAKKTDNMRFSCDHRSDVLTEALRHHEKFAERVLQAPKVRKTHKSHTHT